MGDIGMWPGNFSERGGITWAADWQNLDWGMVALPGDVNAATSGFGNGFAISAEAEKPEAAWKWVVFLSEQIPQFLIPARQSLTNSRDFKNQLGEEAAAAALDSMENVGLSMARLVKIRGKSPAFLIVIGHLLTAIGLKKSRVSGGWISIVG